MNTADKLEALLPNDGKTVGMSKNQRIIAQAVAELRKLDATVDKTGDDKPWLLLSAGAAIGAVITALLIVVL